MKKAILSLLLTGLLGVSFAKECIVEAKILKVRENPDIKSEVIAKLKAGTIAKITDEKEGWYEIGIGWIKKDYCTLLSGDNKEKLKKGLKLSKVSLKSDNGYLPQVIDTLYSYVSISLTDVSRISCPSEIKWFTYSKEKEITIQKASNNLLVKVAPKVISENGQIKEIKRETFPRELLVECNGQIFTLILVPKKIPTQTIVLKPKFESKKKALKFETASPYEETIKQLIKSVYREQPIDGYEIKTLNMPYKNFKRLTMIKNKVYQGAYYKVEEYQLIAKEDVDLHEKLFIPYLSENTLAISLTKPFLKKGEKGRLFVVIKEEQ